LLCLQLISLQTQVDQRLEINKVPQTIKAFCAQIRPVLDQADFNQKRLLVELLIDFVVVSGENVEIRYAIPTHSEGPHLPFCHLRTDHRNYFFEVDKGEIRLDHYETRSGLGWHHHMLLVADTHHF